MFKINFVEIFHDVIEVQSGVITKNSLSVFDMQTLIYSKTKCQIQKKKLFSCIRSTDKKII